MLRKLSTWQRLGCALVIALFLVPAAIRAIPALAGPQADIYTFTYCGACKAVKQYLTGQGVSYTERVVISLPGDVPDDGDEVQIADGKIVHQDVYVDLIDRLAKRTGKTPEQVLDEGFSVPAIFVGDTLIIGADVDAINAAFGIVE